VLGGDTQKQAWEECQLVNAAWPPPSLKGHYSTRLLALNLLINEMSDPRQTYVAVVDDDESVCRSFGRLLRAAGIQPITYRSAEAFLADNRRPGFDCLVLDIQLSGMSGIELQRHLRSAGSTIPVIYITAHDEPAPREEAQAAGCAGYFRKTDPGADVLAAINRAIGIE
jgi:FixJ family two-component response regulator